MAREVKLKVEVLSSTMDSEQVAVAAIRQCYSAIGAEDLMKKTGEKTRDRLIGQVRGSGHVSTLEHLHITFAIEGISRACSHQLVRHRNWAYSQQSQRYVDLSEDELPYVMPPSIAKNETTRALFVEKMEEAERSYRKLIERGVKAEDARFVLPNACETKLVATANATSLLHFFEVRTCRRAQWEIRALAEEMLVLAREIAPKIFEVAGPTCETEGVCWEGDLSCGKWKGIEGGELRVRGQFGKRKQ